MISVFSNRLGFRLLILILVCSSMFSLIASGVQLYFDYKQELNLIDYRIHQIETSYLGSISKALWDLNQELIATQLQGILDLQDIGFVSITMEDGITFSIGDNTTLQTGISREFQLFHSNKKGNQFYLGSLLVSASLDHVYDRLWGKFIVILSTQTLKTFFVSLFILAIVQLLITRHLFKLSEYAEKLDLESLNVPLKLKRSASMKRADELDTVVSSINTMRLNLLQKNEENQRVTQNLRASEERYRLLAENANDVISRHALDGTVLYSSPATFSLVGYAPEELLNKNAFTTIVHPEDLPMLLKRIETLTKDKSAENRAEYRIKHKEGDYIWVESNAKITSSLIQPDQFEVVAITRDITERKVAEKQKTIARLKAEEASNAKSEFLANMSHELRTPMHGVLSYSKFGLNKIDRVPKEKLLHYFRQIRNAGERMMTLLNALLDLSKLEAKQMEFHMSSADIKQIAEQSVSDMQVMIREADIDIQLRNSDANTLISCDTYKIEQVFRNLISNAIKFTPKSKLIQIVFSDQLLTTSGNTVPAIQVAVIDQGIGIPTRELNLIFEKFSQSSKTKTGAGGTGLGLAICKEIVEAHGGRIWAENNQDAGATFKFVLPIEQSQAFKKWQRK